MVTLSRMNWLQTWRLRHQHPINLGLHVLGIPLTIAAVVLAVLQLLEWRWDLWWRPALLLALGYLLQWFGHLVEGNTMGEIILLRKRQGRPYVAVAPRYQKRDLNTPAPFPTHSGGTS